MSDDFSLYRANAEDVEPCFERACKRISTACRGVRLFYDGLSLVFVFNFTDGDHFPHGECFAFSRGVNPGFDPEKLETELRDKIRDTLVMAGKTRI